jgi:hypothetical protein
VCLRKPKLTEFVSDPFYVYGRAAQIEKPLKRPDVVHIHTGEPYYKAEVLGRTNRMFSFDTTRMAQKKKS